MKLTLFWSVMLANAGLGTLTAVPLYAEPWPPTEAYRDVSPQPDAPTPPGPENQAPALASDPPAVVGRVSLLDGTVSFHTAEENAWSYATLNYPVVSGNSFWTEPGAHTEIQFGSAALRLDGGTEADLNELDDQGLRVEVPQGTINLHVESIDNGAVYQIITPRETVNIMQPGTYRVVAGTETAPTEVAVLRGKAQVISSDDAALTATAGETALVAPGDPPQFTVQETEPTSFDNWSLARDNFEEPRQAAHYVSPEMTGYADLDNYGSWRALPAYGEVWVPSGIPAGWAPYHDGYWAYVVPWGWTWVDDAPWGFTPFHYGRWAYVGGNGWCWLPGHVVARPVYAPALVAFVGGAGWGVSIGSGAQPVGWFPLGPNEIYHPGYHVSDNYIRNVNIMNVPNINSYNAHNVPLPRHYANQRFTMVVSAQDFAASRSVDHAALHVSQSQLASAPVASTALPPVALHPEPRSNSGEGGGFFHGHAPVPPTAPLAPDMPSPNNVGHPEIFHPDVNALPPHNADVIHPQQLTPMMAVPHHQPAAAPAALASAPGPAIQPHVIMGAQHSEPSTREDMPMTQPAAATSVPVLSVQRGQPSMVMHDPQTPPVVHPEPHEVNVPHPLQSVPIVPSHQGWTRAPQPQPQPQPHVAQPAHNATPQHGEQPHSDQPHDHPAPGQDQGH